MLRDHLHCKTTCPNENHSRLGTLNEVLQYLDDPFMKDCHIPLEIDFLSTFLWI